MNEFVNLKQNYFTVTEYDTKFDDLSRYAKLLVATPETRKARFINGINHHAKEKLLGFKSSSLYTLVGMALKSEQNFVEFKASYILVDLKYECDNMCIF